jgi:hypothetical protein
VTLPSAVETVKSYDEPLWAGQTIQYLGAGMRTVQQYTFGCFDDWINLTAAGVMTATCSVSTDGTYEDLVLGLLLPGCDPALLGADTSLGRVYYFPDQVKRVRDRTGVGVQSVALVGSYWFVTQGELNTRPVPGSLFKHSVNFSVPVFSSMTRIS